jgi:hypothetical protein
MFLVTTSPYDHWQDADGFGILVLQASLRAARTTVRNQVGEAGVIKNSGGSISYLEQNLIERALR